MRSEKFGNSAKSGYNKGTLRSDILYLVVSKDVRRHRLISISYISQWRCHRHGLDSTFPPTDLRDGTVSPHSHLRVPELRRKGGVRRWVLRLKPLSE